MKRFFITIKIGDSGKRLDKIIPEHLPAYSRSDARRLIENGAVHVGRKRIRKHSYTVQTGETISVREVQTKHKDKEGISTLSIVFDDPWFVVLCKPAGMPADDTLAGSSGTVSSLLSQKFADARIQTVHRLDIGTSGLMVVSKTPAATRDLNRQFQLRHVRKTYIALVHGQIHETAGRIVTFIERDPDNPRKFRNAHAGTKEAITEFRVLKVFDYCSLIDIHLVTGRTHQIRVHLSGRGHPVVGDLLYGSGNDPAQRLMLHATTLSFRCPRSGADLFFESKVPDVFMQTASQIKKLSPDR